MASFNKKNRKDRSSSKIDRKTDKISATSEMHI